MILVVFCSKTNPPKKLGLGEARTFQCRVSKKRTSAGVPCSFSFEWQTPVLLSGELLFDGFDLGVHFRKARLQDHELFRESDRNSRGVQHRCARFDVAENTGLSADRCLVADFDVAGESDLAGERDVVADRRRAGHTDLTAEEAVLADDAVVADLDEIVDFRAFADAG